MPAMPAPNKGIRLTHFVVSEDIARAGRFYTDVLGGEWSARSAQFLTPPIDRVREIPATCGTRMGT